jgi:hypothetical protein
MERDTLLAAIAYMRSMPWVDVKAWLDLALWYGILLTALLCLLRLRTIQRVITEFNKGRGPLWDMRSTVEELKELEPKLRASIAQVSTLTTQMTDLKDQVQALSVQLKELQVETVSQRTGESESTPSVPPDPTAQAEAGPAVRHDEQTEERNWELLREYWRRNTRRLEFVIDQIADGRVKGAFDRLPRTNFTRIVHKLQGQGRISAAVAKASKDLIDEFNRYRPRNRSIPDEVVQGLFVLDQMLDKELVPIATVDSVEEAEDAAPVFRSTQVPNNRRVGQPTMIQRPVETVQILS